jgi:hypothetical protein
MAKERTGYPTQKPVALAERIIQASSNPGDVVLDCFAGCAYAAMAAERLERQWAACDINLRAWTTFKRQFSKPSLAVLDCNDETTGQQVLGNNPMVTIHGPHELPVRTSPDRETTPKTFFILPERRFKVPASIIPEREMLEFLLDLSGYAAWCCGFANRRPDGTVVRTTNNFHLDHIDPKSKDGSHQITNRAPLCPHHNIRKNNRPVALREYRMEISQAGEMLDDVLVDLAWAYQQALDRYALAMAQRGQQLHMAGRF